MKKSLFKNSIYNVLYRTLNALYPLISATYAAHILLSDGVGKVAYSQNIAQYFVLLAALGLPNYGTREIAKCRECLPKTNQMFSELFTINSVSTTVCVVIYYSLILTNDYFATERLLYVVSGLTIVFNYMNVDWFYQGEEEYRYIALRSLVIKLLSIVFLFILVRDKNDYIQYGLIYSLAIGGNYLLNVARLHKFSIKLDFKNLNLRKHMKPVFLLLCTSFSIEIYTLLDTTMLGYLCNDAAVGYYTNSVKLVKVIISIITAVGGVLLPRLSYYYQNNELNKCSEIVNKVFKVMLYLFIPCSIGIILTSEYIIPIFYGDSFLPAITTLKIAALLILVLGFSNLFGTQVLLTFNCEKQLLFSTICGAISNFIMNSLLIPIFQQNGATIASVISETIVTITTYCFAKRFIKIHIKSKEIVSILVAVIVMTILIISYKSLVSNLWLGLVGSIFIGVCSYFTISIGINKHILDDIKLKI